MNDIKVSWDGKVKNQAPFVTKIETIPTSRFVDITIDFDHIEVQGHITDMVTNDNCVFIVDGIAYQINIFTVMKHKKTLILMCAKKDA